MAYKRKTGLKQPQKLSKKLFKGVLLEPIQKPVAALLRKSAITVPDALPGLAMLGQNWVNDQIVERLAALAAHYEVGTSGTFEQRTFKLLMHVVHDFIPGFQFQDEQAQDRRGKRKDDKETGGIDLLVAVEQYITSNQGKRPRDAFKFLVDRKSKSRWAGKTPGALERAFNRTFEKLRENSSEFSQHPFYNDVQKYVKDLRRATLSNQTK